MPKSGNAICRVLAIAGIGLGTVVALVYLATVVPVMLHFYANLLQPRSVASTSNTAGTALLVGTPVPDEGRAHAAEGSPIIYKSNPPASGTHYPTPQPWGIYNEAVAPGYFVHNLEHGGIVVLYDCPSGCPDTVQTLQNAYQTLPRDNYNEVKLVVTPYTGLPSGTRVALLAWDYEVFFPGNVDPQSLLAFYRAHIDNGPEDVP